jgi:hypothetical protein
LIWGNEGRKSLPVHEKRAGERHLLIFSERNSRGRIVLKIIQSGYSKGREGAKWKGQGWKQGFPLYIA